MKTRYLFLLLICITISCVEIGPEVSTDLKGLWNWKYTCGGFAGCLYASEKKFQMLRIRDSDLVMWDNGKATFESSYVVKSATGSGVSKLYQIELNDGEVWDVKVENNHLTIEYFSVISAVYKRRK